MSTAQTLRDVVHESLERAEMAARAMRLDSRLDERLAKATTVKDLPAYRRLTLGSGVSSWAAILFVDLRRSTERAQRIGARKTFLTMHALLPALAYAVSESDGYVVGFRGDGLFAAFGLNEHGNNEPTRKQPEAVSTASQCGEWMLEAVEHVVNPALESRSCPGGLRIGVGVDCGTVIITRIGLQAAEEVTAYGDAVNRSAKLADVADSSIIISDAAHDLFPSGPGGKVRLHPVAADPKARRVEYPQPLLFQLGASV